MNPKILAFYLPQFHQVPENDKWWGEGFTEWTAVKDAKKLFDRHNQPRVPLNKNYYNLLHFDTMSWQAELMKKYHIDGMCIYHYWFENGRRILEKPAENLLKWHEIQMPFCFCWANETWSRTWKKYMDTNVWFGKGDMAQKDTILLKQIYGRERDWEVHFQYLLPFFKDDRYIKLNGKPVFVIFKPSQIFQLWEMLTYFEKQIKENGFQGIYVIGMGNEWVDGLNAICIRQPYSAMAEYQKYNNFSQGLPIYPYDELCKMQTEITTTYKPAYFSCVVDYDSTPRMGQSGVLLQGASPEKFSQCFEKLYRKSILSGNEFLFINAWNEWGESMYLEPDEKNGHQYLSSVCKVVEKYKDINISVESNQEYKRNHDIESELSRKLKRHDRLLENWMRLRDYKIDFADYFRKYMYCNIAIYGMGRLGIHLQYELEKSGIHIKYGIDRRGQGAGDLIKIYNPFQKLPEVDAVVITILGEYKEIGQMLRNSICCPMISLEEIIQELLFYCEE